MIAAERWLRSYQPHWFRSDLAAGVTRAGSVVNFVSETVLIGFNAGVALQLASTQPDLLRINSQPETKEDSPTGRFTIRTWWSANGTQLVSAVSLRTKDLHDAHLTIVRKLAD
jgi:MFS superfamily sulfate permease-like transporter